MTHIWHTTRTRHGVTVHSHLIISHSNMQPYAVDEITHADGTVETIRSKPFGFEAAQEWFRATGHSPGWSPPELIWPH